nr:CHAD domain-containing protein [Ktedonobacteraceae bacterium]
MRKQEAPVYAAIDIGSNTIHLVVARCKPDDLEILEDQVEMVRIGESVTANGEISAQKLQDSLATLRAYKALAKKHKAKRVLVVATEAIRKASNSADFLEQVQRKTGLQVNVISGTTEATLTFYGATYEESKEAGTSAVLGVMDLGGGSTELVSAKNMRIVWRTSIPIGSGWLHDRYLLSNPPTGDELAVAETFLRTYLQGMRLKNAPARLIVTGGSANSLLYLAQAAHRLDKDRHRLTYDELVRCEGLVSALPAEEIHERYGQPTSRALVLPAGALIMREVMQRLHLQEIAISPHGIREGALLAYARYGEQWLERVNEESASTQQAATQVVKDGAIHGVMVDEPFIEAGRQMLRERAEKLFEWHDEVLQDEDVEAVHKMRVATRRLRATLDAFETCSRPRQFKKVYRRIKEMADILGSARDTDVMLQGLRDTREHVVSEEKAGVQWLIDRLGTYREQRQEALEDFFRSLDEDELRREIEACIQTGAASNGKS